MEIQAERPDVLVIGGGVIGVCAAYYLTRSGARVTVVEKDEVCSGSSWGNAGLLVPSHCIPLSVPGVTTKAIKWMLHSDSPLYIRPRLDKDLIAWLWRFHRACNPRMVRTAMRVLLALSLASLELYSELVQIANLDFGLQRAGLLSLFLGKGDCHEGADQARLLREHGVRAVEMTADEVHDLEPAVAPEVVGGIYFPEDAHITPADFVVGLSKVITALGARILTSTEVSGFETSGKRVTLVKTTRGVFRPVKVVLAAGAWSAALARQLRLRIPLQAGKGYSVTFERPEDSPKIPLLLGEAKCAVTPMGRTLRIAGTLEFGSLDGSINQGRVDCLLRALNRYVVGMTNLRVWKAWAGLRPCTPDGMPVIDTADGLENLILATGHGMLGVSLGPVTGKIVSQLISGTTPAVDISELRVGRFS